jgi:hypothetical protein
MRSYFGIAVKHYAVPSFRGDAALWAHSRREWNTRLIRILFVLLAVLAVVAARAMWRIYFKVGARAGTLAARSLLASSSNTAPHGHSKLKVKPLRCALCVPVITPQYSP